MSEPEEPAGPEPGPASAPGPGEPSEPSEGDDRVAELLAEADLRLQEAEDALADGDLGLYQDKVEEARRLVDEALGLTGSAGTTTTTTEPADTA